MGRGAKVNGEPARVVGYARVSTEGQADHGHGLPAQKDAIRRYCQQQDWQLLGIYQDVISGAAVDEDALTVNRPGLLDLLAGLKEQHPAYIVVIDTSRLWRSDTAKVLIRRELRRHGVDVRSTTQPTYSLTVKDPSDVLVNGMLELLDEYERLTITMRLRRGRVQKARQGGYAGGLPPFGYQATRGGKQLTVHPEEAAVVRQVFNLRRSGLTRYAIAARLNGEGIPTREGKRWAHTQVGRILTRGPVYRGRIYRYGEVESTEAQQPAILGKPA
ncbi:MAG: recombinase family protein [bacterium]|nr:recombinase family protein [bacterium]